MTFFVESFFWITYIIITIASIITIDEAVKRLLAIRKHRRNHE